MMRYFPSNAT